MTEDQKTLVSVLENQRILIAQIQDLNTQIESRRQDALKLQGVLEYLSSKGVVLPEEPQESQEVEEIQSE